MALPSTSSGSSTQAHPLQFTPLLYFMQAIPVTLVQETSTIIFKNLDVGNADIVYWTSLIALPWSLQMFLGPFVDQTAKKRSWVLGGQLAIALGIILTAFALRLPNSTNIAIGVLGVTAIFSAMCNIATDGFYLLALKPQDQARFVGFNSTFYRLGRLFCSGLLVYSAGRLMGTYKLPADQAWFFVLLGCGILYGLGRATLHHTLPRPDADIKVGPSEGGEGVAKLAVQTGIVLTLGLSAIIGLGNARLLIADQIGRSVSEINYIGSTESWKLSAAAVEGNQIWLASMVVVFVLARQAYRRFIAPTTMGDSFRTYFQQSGIAAILGFILFYRFGEAMVGKLTSLFLLDPVAKGGLGMSTEHVGIVNGTVGVIGIVLGGIAGGLTVSKLGLRRAFIPLALAMHVPNFLYLWASTARPQIPADAAFWAVISAPISSIIFVDQFGYGFGFAAYFVYLMWVAQRGKFHTAHYAMGTGLGALCIATAGILSGILFQNFGYVGFYKWVIALSIPGMLMLFLIPLDEHQGRNIKVDEIAD